MKFFGAISDKQIVGCAAVFLGVFLLLGHPSIAASEFAVVDLEEVGPQHIEYGLLQGLVEAISANPDHSVVAVEYSWRVPKDSAEIAVWEFRAISAKGRLFYIPGDKQLVRLSQAVRAGGCEELRWRIWYNVEASDLSLGEMSALRRLDAKDKRFASGWKSFRAKYEGPAEAIVWP